MSLQLPVEEYGPLDRPGGQRILLGIVIGNYDLGLYITILSHGLQDGVQVLADVVLC